MAKSHSIGHHEINGSCIAPTYASQTKPDKINTLSPVRITDYTRRIFNTDEMFTTDRLKLETSVLKAGRIGFSKNKNVEQGAINERMCQNRSYTALIATKDGRMLCTYSKIPYKIPSQANGQKETSGED